MTTQKKDRRAICDVFITHGADERDTALELAEAIRNEGMTPYRIDDAAAQIESEAVIREAIAECRALVVIVSQPALPPSVVVVIGAAQMWNKPIHVVTAGRMARIPGWLQRASVAVTDSGDDAVRAIRQATIELDRSERKFLAEVYQGEGTLSELIALDTEERTSLSDQFAAKAGKTVPSVQLLGEILRMRKRGELASRRRNSA